MTQDVDVRSVPLPGPTFEAVKRLARRTLELDGSGGFRDTERFLVALFGSGTALFGHLHGFGADDIRTAASQAGLADPPVADVKELSGLLHAVVPETPVCVGCGEFALANAGGKISTLPAGAACPFCKKGAVATVPTKLRILRWTDGALVEPTATHDHRTGDPIPIQDVQIIERYGDRLNPVLMRALHEEETPIYAFLAYAHLTLGRLEGDLSKVGDLLDRPMDFGFSDISKWRDATRKAVRFVRAREIAVGIPDDPTDDATAVPDIRLDGRGYVLEERLGQGDVSDVWRGRSTGLFPERVIVKVGRSADDGDLMRAEVAALRKLRDNDDPATSFFTKLVPAVVAHNVLPDRDGTPRPVTVLRSPTGFDWSLEQVMAEYPEGVEPETAVWIWDRVLKTLTWTHRVGFVHGSVLPSHVLIHPVDHGASLVGWTFAVRHARKEPIPAVSAAYEAWYPKDVSERKAAKPELDIVLSAKTMIALLGGDPQTGDLPKKVPAEMAGFLKRHARLDGSDAKLGDAMSVFTAFAKITVVKHGRKYHPIRLPR